MDRSSWVGERLSGSRNPRWTRREDDRYFFTTDFLIVTNSETWPFWRLIQFLRRQLSWQDNYHNNVLINVVACRRAQAGPDAAVMMYHAACLWQFLGERRPLKELLELSIAHVRSDALVLFFCAQGCCFKDYSMINISSWFDWLVSR